MNNVPKPNNSLSAQQLRLIEYLRENKQITTIEARQYLEIMHPAGRIKELREHHNIKTHWKKQQGHLIANYVLLSSHDNVSGGDNA